MVSKRWDILWNTRLGVRYHMHLQNFYSKAGKFITVFSLVTSSAAFVTIYQNNTTCAKVLACLVTLAQILDLVVDTKGRSLFHASLRQKYLYLESDIIAKEEHSEDELTTFQQRRISIEIEEPPIMNSVIDLCHNELVKVHNCGDDKLEKMDAWPSIKAWFFS